jgi:hypothetical protein
MCSAVFTQCFGGGAPPSSRPALDAGRAVRSLFAGLALIVAAAMPARADFKVHMPDVEAGELAIEPLGDLVYDPLNLHSHEASFTEGLEYGVNGFWRTEIELEQDRPPGSDQAVDFSQVNWENVFQFTRQGEYWADAGFFAEFGHSALATTLDETTFGPIFRKEVFGTINTVNLLVEKEFGPYSGRLGFLYAWETRIALGTPVEPGLQAYGRPSNSPGFNSGWPQDNRIGPQLFGKIAGFGCGSFKWSGGVLFGISAGAPRITLRWEAEYTLDF